MNRAMKITAINGVPYRTVFASEDDVNEYIKALTNAYIEALQGDEPESINIDVKADYLKRYPVIVLELTSPVKEPILLETGVDEQDEPELEFRADCFVEDSDIQRYVDGLNQMFPQFNFFTTTVER